MNAISIVLVQEYEKDEKSPKIKLNTEILSHLIGVGCKTYSTDKFNKRISIKLKGDHSIITDMVTENTFHVYFTEIQNKLKTQLKDSPIVKLTTLINTIKDITGQIIGHNKDKLSSDISDSKRKHFISAFFIDLIQKGHIKGKVTELLSKDLDDSQFDNLAEITIDKEKIEFIIKKLDEFMEGYGLIQGEKEAKDIKDAPNMPDEIE